MGDGRPSFMIFTPTWGASAEAVGGGGSLSCSSSLSLPDETNMINSRRSRAGVRASFCHIEVHRSEQRGTGSGSKPYTVFMVRLSSELGEYPSADSYYELPYKQLQKLHEHMREHYQALQLPWLPRMPWLSARHPRFLQEMCDKVQRYLQHLLASWSRATARIDGFIFMLHQLHEAAAGVATLPLPNELPQPTDDADYDVFAGSTRVEQPTNAGRVPSHSSGLPSLAERESLGWRSYQEYVERMFTGQAGRPLTR